jgi:hypothetical protein
MRYFAVAFLLLVVVGCRDASDSPGLAISWHGNYETRSAAYISGGSQQRDAGPRALEYLLVRFAPGGESAAAVVRETESGVPSLVVFRLDGKPPLLDLGGVVAVQDVSFSPDGSRIAVISTERVTFFHERDGAWTQTRPSVELGSRVSGPITGDVWSPDGAWVAVQLTSGVVALEAGGEGAVEVPFEGAPFGAAAVLAGWTAQGEVLVRDFATDIYYAREPGGETWRPTMIADPLAEYFLAAERCVSAIEAETGAFAVSTVRLTADRDAVVVSGYTAEETNGVTQGPFDLFVALCPLSETGSSVFDLGQRVSIGAVREGRLVDAILD